MMTFEESLKNLNNNRLKWIVAAAALLLFTPILTAQRDTTSTQMPGKQKRVEVPTKSGTVIGEKAEESERSSFFTEQRSPKKAALMSAVVPGLGQAYNRKYWKIPILYAGFAVAGWYLNDNLTNINLYRNAFIAEIDGNPETTNDTGFAPPQLERLIDQYTEWRDLSYIAFGIIYILNIIDASVDAHLFYFDVSEDISMNIRPHWSPFMFSSPGLSLTLKL